MSEHLPDVVSGQGLQVEIEGAALSSSTGKVRPVYGVIRTQMFDQPAPLEEVTA